MTVTGVVQFDANALLSNLRSRGFSVSLPPPRARVATMLASAGAVTLAGVSVGDKVISVQDATAVSDVSGSFESTISVAGQIQQTAAGTAGHALTITIQPASSVPVTNPTANNPFSSPTNLVVTPSANLSDNDKNAIQAVGAGVIALLS